MQCFSMMINIVDLIQVPLSVATSSQDSGFNGPNFTFLRCVLIPFELAVKSEPRRITEMYFSTLLSIFSLSVEYWTIFTHGATTKKTRGLNNVIEYSLYFLHSINNKLVLVH